MFNYAGIKYFIYITSLNNKLYLPIDIRKIIWEEYHLLKIIKCLICNKVLINFNVNISSSVFLAEFLIIAVDKINKKTTDIKLNFFTAYLLNFLFLLSV